MAYKLPGTRLQAPWSDAPYLGRIIDFRIIVPGQGFQPLGHVLPNLRFQVIEAVLAYSALLEHERVEFLEACGAGLDRCLGCPRGFADEPVPQEHSHPARSLLGPSSILMQEEMVHVEIDVLTVPADRFLGQPLGR